MTMLFNAIGETPDSEANDEILYDQLIEHTDRLLDLIAGTNTSLDDLTAAAGAPHAPADQVGAQRKPPWVDRQRH